MYIGTNIKQLRKEKNITQEDLGKTIGVSTSMVGMYETNARKPSYEVLLNIAKYFDTTTDYLFGNSNGNVNTAGGRIKQTRQQLGMSVDDLALRLDKNRATVYRYENNEEDLFIEELKQYFEKNYLKLAALPQDDKDKLLKIINIYLED